MGRAAALLGVGEGFAAAGSVRYMRSAAHGKGPLMESARRQNVATLLLASAVLVVVFMAIAYFKDDNDATGFIVSVAVSLVVAAALFLWLWDRMEARPAYWSLIVGAVAIVSCAVFWLGLPFVFGPAAVGLGRRDAASETRSKVGVGLGAVAVGLAALACIFG